MARIVLAPALARWLPPDAKAATSALAGEVALDAEAATVGEALAAAFALHPRLRGYVLDEQGAVRHHVAVFVDGAALRDKHDLSQRVGADAEIHVMQALSGG
jgi:hypothetical protein